MLETWQIFLKKVCRGILTSIALGAIMNTCAGQHYKASTLNMSENGSTPMPVKGTSKQRAKRTARPSRREPNAQNAKRAAAPRVVKPVKASELVIPRSWCFYGRSGSGKTTLAGTFPGKVLFLDVRDRGTDSVSDVEDAYVLPIESWQDFEDAFYFAQDNSKEYRTVVIDTVSQLQQMVVEELVGDKVKRSKGNKMPGDWGTMSKQLWGEVAGKLKQWILNFRDLPVEVVFIAQDRSFDPEEDEDEADALLPEIGPALSPAVKSHLCASVSIVGYTFVAAKTVKKKVFKKTVEKEVIQYGLRLGASPVYITKVRKPKDVSVPDVILDPSYEQIMAIMKGKN